MTDRPDVEYDRSHNDPPPKWHDMEVPGSICLKDFALIPEAAGAKVTDDMVMNLIEEY